MCRDSIHAVCGRAHRDTVFSRIAEASYQSVDGFDTPIYQIWGFSTIATFVRATLRQIQAPAKAPGGSANVAEAKILATVDIVLCRRQRRFVGRGVRRAVHYQDNRLYGWDKDTAAITYKLTGSTLAQIGTVGTGVAVLAPEPVSKAVAGAVGGVGSAAAYTISASRHYSALGQGKYNEMLSKI